MMIEIWKPIKNFEDLYEISNLGRVKSLPRSTTNGCIIKTHLTKGYETTHICKNGKHYDVKIHRLVAEAFIDNPNNLPEVNHKDENKLNNAVDNLEWCNSSYNRNYGTRLERIAAKVKKEISQYDKSGNLIKKFSSSIEVEQETGFLSSGIRHALSSKTNFAYGYIWKYAQQGDVDGNT